jgi:spore maturation protein CgeB
MKVLCVGPASYYSTFDVWQGQTAGFAANGCEVFQFDYGKRLRIFNEFYQWAKRHRSLTPEFKERIYAWSGESIYITAKVHQVDLVWLVAPMHVHPVPLGLLRMDGIRTAGYATEAPYEDDVWVERAGLFDYCFVCDRNSVERWRERNPQSFYLGHAYDPARHFPSEPSSPEAPPGLEDWLTPYDVVFVGTGFPARRKFLEAVDWTGIDFRAFGHWRSVPKAATIRQYLEARILANEETAAVYRRARIGLQLHRSDTYYRHGWRMKPGAAYSLGPRSYELAACGVFQVSDERPELHDVFDGSVPTFSTPAELGALVRRYLASPEERADLAAKQHEAVAPYTFASRMKEVLTIVS